MLYEMKNCCDGTNAVYYTSVEVSEKNGIFTFVFTAENSKYYCPYKGHNEKHFEGDVCEIFIGSNENRNLYYEIEVNPNNDTFLALIEYRGETEQGPDLHRTYFEKSFLTTSVNKFDGGYIATVSFPKEKILCGNGEIYFNAFRIDTDGEQPEKHLFAVNPPMRPRFHTPEFFIPIE